MNPIKLKRIRRLAESLRDVDRSLSQELFSIVEMYENKTLKFRDCISESSADALGEIANLLQGKKWCLAGGLAVIHWTPKRVTYDVDCLVFSDDLREIIKQYPDAQKGNFGYSVEIADKTVDFLGSQHFPFAVDAIRNAVMKDIMGVKVPVMTPEYLVLFKLSSMREKDNQDAFDLLRVQGVPNKARALFKRFLSDMVDDLEQAISISQMEG